MAKIRSNVLVHGLSGKLGDQIVFRQLRDGRTVLCKKPDFSNRKLSKDQKAHHAKFKEAALYAREAAKRQPVYAQLAEGTLKNAYNVALSDWFHPPVIHRVKMQSEMIRVEASDDVQVTAVKVTILSAEGTILEQGEAVPSDNLWWDCPSQLAWEGTFKVEVQVYDLAGNVTREVMNYE